MEHWLLLSLSGASSLLWSWGVVRRASAACILGAAALPTWSRLLLEHLDETSNYNYCNSCLKARMGVTMNIRHTWVVALTGFPVL